MPWSGGFPDTSSLSAWFYSGCGARGRRELWKEIMPRDPAAFGGFGNVILTPDRKTYAYNLNRVFCTLYLVEGLK